MGEEHRVHSLSKRDLGKDALLEDDAQYSVVATAAGGTITAIVTEFAPGGDNAMAYEGFAAP